LAAAETPVQRRALTPVGACGVVEVVAGGSAAPFAGCAVVPERGAPTLCVPSDEDPQPASATTVAATARGSRSVWFSQGIRIGRRPI
jgi:hypothetical protein